MSFPKTYDAIAQMVEQEALRVPTARAIVRKAGLRAGGSGGGTATGTVRTAADIWLFPNNVAFSYQFLVDLTGYDVISFDCQSPTVAVGVYYSTSTSSALNPGDYTLWRSERLNVADPLLQPFPLQDQATFANPTTELRWFRIPEERRIPLRLALGTVTSGTPGPSNFTFSPGSFSFEGFGAYIRVGLI